jgi:hypothetical protein
VASAVAATDTTINVASTVGMPTQGYINIESETILYQNVSGNQLLNCYRGVNNTAAVSHAVNTQIFQTFLPNINIWPTGNPGTQYTFIYWRMRRVQNAGTGVSEQDIPFRFINCLVAGLAYNLSVKLSDVDPNRIIMLKADYEQQFQLAADEDREKAPVRFVPRQLFY